VVKQGEKWDKVVNYDFQVHALVSIDDKGRLLLPIKLRESLQDCPLVLTRGVEECLWLFTASTWQSFAGQLSSSLSIFDAGSRLIQRRILAPAGEVLLDNTGRLKLNPSLMTMAKFKRECYLIGMGDHIEIWDAELYTSYDEATSGRLEEAFVSLSPVQKLKVEN
jgi:MraZ protein